MRYKTYMLNIKELSNSIKRKQSKKMCKRFAEGYTCDKGENVEEASDFSTGRKIEYEEFQMATQF